MEEREPTPAPLGAEEAAQELPVRELMSANVECVQASDPIGDVAKRMAELRISCVVVIDEDRRPVGILSERDMVRVAADPASTPLVGDAMTTPVQTLGGDRSLANAIFETGRHKIRRLVIVDSAGCVEGVVTQTDLLRAYVGKLERLVRERTLALQKSNDELKRLTRCDALLGIGNRHALEEDLARLHSLSMRHAHAYSVVVADLDHFKQVNDQHGHAAGDDALRGVCRHIQDSLRTSDMLYRMGGDEFVILLPETGGNGAEMVAERVRQIVELHSVELGGVTISAGVATLRLRVAGIEAVDEDPWTIVSRADGAAYEAKDGGRNRVCRAS